MNTPTGNKEMRLIPSASGRLPQVRNAKVPGKNPPAKNPTSGAIIPKVPWEHQGQCREAAWWTLQNRAAVVQSHEHPQANIQPQNGAIMTAEAIKTTVARIIFLLWTRIQSHHLGLSIEKKGEAINRLRPF